MLKACDGVSLCFAAFLKAQLAADRSRGQVARVPQRSSGPRVPGGTEPRCPHSSMDGTWVWGITVGLEPREAWFWVPAILCPVLGGQSTPSGGRESWRALPAWLVSPGLGVAPPLRLALLEPSCPGPGSGPCSPSVWRRPGGACQPSGWMVTGSPGPHVPSRAAQSA